MDTTLKKICRKHYLYIVFMTIGIKGLCRFMNNTFEQKLKVYLYHVAFKRISYYKWLYRFKSAVVKDLRWLKSPYFSWFIRIVNTKVCVCCWKGLMKVTCSLMIIAFNMWLCNHLSWKVYAGVMNAKVYTEQGSF